ncbi:hypothetical protein K466DRAFT_289088 [Polyporus arcularius HHB13444]|uniref:Uncharacterized protein n=1 Tax=Polyporus arcularius HHB13444 TaxID=1314778 RepID=A0A5C3NZ67_9APHY|nr:hypothetical protein K466DRAFT_289088 [Polyporus arcularius HHB13444]
MPPTATSLSPKRLPQIVLSSLFRLSRSSSSDHALQSLYIFAACRVSLFLLYGLRPTTYHPSSPVISPHMPTRCLLSPCAVHSLIQTSI